MPPGSTGADPGTRVPIGGGGAVRTFDFDAFDAFDSRERPGEQILPWEMWERERPWREDSVPLAGDPPPGRGTPE